MRIADWIVKKIQAAFEDAPVVEIETDSVSLCFDELRIYYRQSSDHDSAVILEHRFNNKPVIDITLTPGKSMLYEGIENGRVRIL